MEMSEVKKEIKDYVRDQLQVLRLVPVRCAGWRHIVYL